MEIFTILLLLYFLYLILQIVMSHINDNYKEITIVEQIPKNKNTFNLPKKNKTELKSVVGLKSVKEEMKYYFDFINNSEKYKHWNVKLPKGILLVGPPGTGKTLIGNTNFIINISIRS